MVHTLAEGTDQLAGGSAKLASGADTLHSGTAQLQAGSDTLAEGVQQLLDGARELRDGMLAFDEEGIGKLSEFAEEDAEDLIDRLRALKDLAGEYTAFSGDHSSGNGSVQFIIRTESIG